MCPLHTDSSVPRKDQFITVLEHNIAPDDDHLILTQYNFCQSV